MNKYITFPFEFHNFLQFLLDIKVSQIHDFVYSIGFMTLSKTNSPQMQGKKVTVPSPLTQKICLWMLHKICIIKSSQYKKLVSNAFQFTYWTLKFCKLHITKKKHRNARFIDENHKEESDVHCFILYVICKISNFKVHIFWEGRKILQK